MKGKKHKDGLAPKLRDGAAIAALSSQEASSAASLAFRDICKACGAQLGAYLEALVQLYQRIQGAGALNGGGGGGGGGNGMTLDEEDVQQVSYSLSLNPKLYTLSILASNCQDRGSAAGCVYSRCFSFRPFTRLDLHGTIVITKALSHM